MSYGIESITIIARVGGVYLNFGLWAVAIFPAWLVLKHFGTEKIIEVETSAAHAESLTSGEDAEVAKN